MPHLMLKDNLSWSLSRQSVFEECKRKYYYTYYGYWNGWRSDADPEVRKTYILKNMTNLKMFSGDVVHRVIEEVLRSLRYGKTMELESAKERARKLLNQGWKQSKARRWTVDPKRNVNLFEHYYKMVVTDEQIDKIRENVTLCLANFFGSEIFRELQSSDPRTWVKFDSMESFDLDGIKVFAVPDFAFEKDGRVRLFDWKSGNLHSSHEMQMNCYALLMERKLSRPLPSLDFNIFYLKSGDVVEITVTENDRKQMIHLIKSSFRDMISLLEDSSNNLARIDAFPMTDQARRCEMCFFRELCFPEDKVINIL